MGTSLNRARRGLLALLPAMLLAVLALAASPAHAAGGLDAVAEGLKKSPVYVDPRASSQLSSADAAALEKKIKDANKPVFVAVLPDSPEYPRATLLRLLRTKVGVTGVYVVHLGDKGFNAAADAKVMSHSTVSNIVLDAKSSASDAKTELNTFVDQADQVAKGHAPSSWGDSGGSGGSGAAAGAIAAGVIVLGAGGGGYVLYRRAKKKKAERERAALDQLRTVVDEDITAFGEELERLDFSPADPSATDAMRGDYTHALDAYDRAKSLMAAAAKPDDVRPVTEALEDGRFSLATLAARRTGAPLPERRVPCFFDPRHGPSVRDVEWAPAGGAVRSVPACAADASRIADGAEPMTRHVQTAYGPQPYWDAGPAYAPWAGGYFGGGMLPGLLIGTMLGSALSTPAYAYDGGGFGGGEMGGGFDSGPQGGDFSGADFNPGDFSGGFGDTGGGFGDFGGGDSGGFGGGDW